MLRLYTFLLEGSFRTGDIKAHNPIQAYKKAVKSSARKVIPVYQTCPLNAFTYNGWTESQALNAYVAQLNQSSDDQQMPEAICTDGSIAK